ncbi:MAG: hypothetical protein IJ925_03260 [Muribaculaceae bacterium]|nr:hypothetical protein [Muribaculaceae bacterium]
MDYELDEMRQQLAILKNKLDDQTIVNDRLIRRAVKNSVSTINKRYLVISIIAFAMIPYGYWAFVVLNGLSIPLWIAMSVLMLAVIGFCIYNGHEMRKNDFVSDNLLETKRKALKAQKRDAMWPYFGIPVAIGWAAWVGWEMTQKLEGDFLKYFIPWFIICVTAGALLGLKVHFKTQRHFRDILEQIEDVEDAK